MKILLLSIIGLSLLVYPLLTIYHLFFKKRWIGIVFVLICISAGLFDLFHTKPSNDYTAIYIPGIILIISNAICFIINSYCTKVGNRIPIFLGHILLSIIGVVSTVGSSYQVDEMLVNLIWVMLNMAALWGIFKNKRWGYLISIGTFLSVFAWLLLWMIDGVLFVYCNTELLPHIIFAVLIAFFIMGVFDQKVENKSNGVFNLSISYSIFLGIMAISGYNSNSLIYLIPSLTIGLICCLTSWIYHIRKMHLTKREENKN